MSATTGPFLETGLTSTRGTMELCVRTWKPGEELMVVDTECATNGMEREILLFLCDHGTVRDISEI
jgi:hypothetical protein